MCWLATAMLYHSLHLLTGTFAQIPKMKRCDFFFSSKTDGPSSSDLQTGFFLMVAAAATTTSTPETFLF